MFPLKRIKTEMGNHRMDRFGTEGVLGLLIRETEQGAKRLKRWSLSCS